MSTDKIATDVAQIREQLEQLQTDLDAVEEHLHRFDDMVTDVAESLPANEE